MGFEQWVPGDSIPYGRIDLIGLDSKVYGANMGHTWGRQDPGGPRVDPMNFAIWEDFESRV